MRSWRHPWLVVELITRALVGVRLAQGPSDAHDHALMTVMAMRRAIVRAGWFN